MATDLEATELISGMCGDNVKWTLDDTTWELNIFGTGAMYDYKSSSDNRPPFYDYRSSIKIVNIGNGVTTIGNYSFYNCSAITSVTIPDSVTRIGNFAFCYCSKLTSVYFEGAQPTFGGFSFDTGGKTTIYTSGWASDSVFTSGVIGLNTILTYKLLLPGGSCGVNAEWEFDESTGTLRIYGTGEMYGYDTPDSPMPSPWATYTDDITSIIIEEGITGLGHFAFSFTPITSITIPSTVTFIGTCVFQSCTSLTEIIFLGEQPKMLSNAFFITDWKYDTASATIYSNGWASDDVFTTSIKGSSNITFTYKPLGGGAVTIPVNVNGSWKDAIPYANVNGVWKEITVYMNVNGTWKESV